MDMPQAIAPSTSKGSDADQLTRLEDKRLSWLRDAGGSVSQKNGEFRVIGMAKLVRNEKANGVMLRSEKTIRVQLKAAYERELESTRNGPFDGLSSR